MTLHWKGTDDFLFFNQKQLSCNPELSLCMVSQTSLSENLNLENGSQHDGRTGQLVVSENKETQNWIPQSKDSRFSYNSPRCSAAPIWIKVQQFTCIWYWGGTCGANAVGPGHNRTFAHSFGKETYRARKNLCQTAWQGAQGQDAALKHGTRCRGTR